MQDWKLTARADPEPADYFARRWYPDGLFSTGYTRKMVSEPENGVRLGKTSGPRELDTLDSTA